ncbi:hypothetical protein DSO57_1002153 [Entomophthora muscae]|uniref:Uncharacterized protein n=1 Tax=Entomophthora muscae TaxID=34485 RepID=A0ACC2SLG3_9FUNG|nr:hypothetical protein DSO57_1002153 [Entomophthora muscae]
MFKDILISCGVVSAAEFFRSQVFPNSELRLGSNPLAGFHTIPKNCTWAGAPANFTAAHMFDAKRTRPTVSRAFGEFYNLRKLALWVSRKKVDLDYRCLPKSGCNIVVATPISLRNSIAIDAINSFDPRVLYYSDAEAYHKGACQNWELKFKDYWSPRLKGWLYQIHLEARISTYIHSDDDIQVTGDKLVRIPIRLEDGQCDVYFGTDFVAPQETLTYNRLRTSSPLPFWDYAIRNK